MRLICPSYPVHGGHEQSLPDKRNEGKTEWNNWNTRGSTRHKEEKVRRKD